MQQDASHTLITIDATDVIGNNGALILLLICFMLFFYTLNELGWYSYDKSSNTIFTFKRNSTFEFERS
ncbi:unnamed protein product [Rotaria magnacalcarata]|uniref:Uncharacterized protein n=2 Tax=Rotaria magnacalcarata TaxID=392030 RepID=A0A8S3ECS4_9BILA|nr:unnamed protein product [Rotaria magnacalcarata]CAF5184249.1 unnamed protein product [Rotaria magnacalcarata]